MAAEMISAGPWNFLEFLHHYRIYDNGGRAKNATGDLEWAAVCGSGQEDFFDWHGSSESDKLSVTGCACGR